jgi:hypothetical protein
MDNCQSRYKTVPHLKHQTAAVVWYARAAPAASQFGWELSTAMTGHAESPRWQKCSDEVHPCESAQCHLTNATLLDAWGKSVPLHSLAMIGHSCTAAAVAAAVGSHTEALVASLLSPEMTCGTACWGCRQLPGHVACPHRRVGGRRYHM